MEYKIAVTFTRNLGDDAEVLRPRRATRAALVRQFVKELQQFAFNDGAMAGQFRVTGITLRGRTSKVRK